MSLIHIVLLILVLASFVIAFFSARTWHWGHVLVVLGIFLSTLGFFILSAEVLRINAVLRTEFNRVESQLNEVSAQNVALEKGTSDANILGQLRNSEPPVKMPEDAESIASLTDLDHLLLLETRRRGRVWRNAKRAGEINPQTGAVTVTLEAPVPAGLPKDTVVYLFEEGEAQLPGPDGQPRGAQYLGEFRVTGESAGQQATLLPALPMGDFERQRLAASRLTWSIYETMPADRHEIFAGLTAEQLQQKLPPQSVTEYSRDGQDATADDDPSRVIGFDADGNRLPPDQVGEAVTRKYSRRLRDYAAEFDAMSRRRLEMEADIAGVKQDIERLVAAQESAKKLQAFREGERTKLTDELAGVTKERQAIDAHLALVEAQLAKARQLLAATLQRNSEMAKALTELQLRSKRPAGGATSPAETASPLALGQG